MANAIRIVTVERGVDPRDHALIAIGGAGPTHAAEIAEAIGIERVIVPLHPGLTSALGALTAPIRVDEVQSVRLNGGVPASELAARFAALQRTALQKFARQGGAELAPTLTRTIAMRYEGQNYEEEMALGPGEIGEPELADVVERYHERHQSFYGYRLPGLTVEFVHISVSVTAEDRPLPALRLSAQGQVASGPAPGERIGQVHFGAGGFRPTAIVSRADLLGTGERPGPLLVQAPDTTIVVPPGWWVCSDEVGILELRRAGGSDVESEAGAVTTTGAPAA
jgi:N-methylhydantoinase A